MIPPTTELWSRFFADRGNSSLRNEISLRYTAWVWKLVRQYLRLHPGTKRTADELFSDGFIGLLKALERYQPDGGASFLTYSRYSIRTYISRGGRHVTVSEIRAWKARRHRWQLMHATGRYVNDAELARSLKIEEAKLAQIWEQERAHRPQALDSPIGDDATHGDLVPGRTADPANKASERDEIQSALSLIEKRYRKSVWMRLARGKTLAVVATEIGKTRQRADQIVQKCVNRIRMRWNRRMIRRIDLKLQRLLPRPNPGPLTPPVETVVETPTTSCCVKPQAVPKRKPPKFLGPEAKKWYDLKREEAFFQKCAAKANPNTAHGRSVHRALERIRTALEPLREHFDVPPDEDDAVSLTPCRSCSSSGRQMIQVSNEQSQ